MPNEEKKYTIDDILEEYAQKKAARMAKEQLKEAENSDTTEDTVETSGFVDELLSTVPQEQVSDMSDTVIDGDNSFEKNEQNALQVKNPFALQIEPENVKEENDNCEKCEEQDLSAESFSHKALFEPAELFGGNIPENVVQTDGELSEYLLNNDESSSNSELADDEFAEEIFADEAAEDDTEDVPVDILEADLPADEDTDIVFEEANEEDVLPEISQWTESGASEEFTEEDAAEIQRIIEDAINEEKVAEPSEPEKIEETEITENNSDEDMNIDTADTEDVNERFMKKFLKGLIPWKGDSVGEIIRKIIFLAAIIVFIGAGIMLVSTLIQSHKAVGDKEKNQSVITTTVATTIDNDGNIVIIAPTDEEVAQHNFNVAEYYKGINEDYVGYLELDGCDIYEPVMQGDDNDYYLTHTYYGGENKAGTIFMDYRCKVSDEYVSPNLVFYGHNQEDGTMFGNLKEYKQNVEFYKENPVVKFNTEYETGEYLIYGFFVTHVRPDQDRNGEVFHYHDYIETLKDESKFDWYIGEIQKRNQIVSPVDVQYGDKLLCLSTCSNEFTDSRFVVFARKLRDGESVSDYDFSEAYINPNAKGVDWAAIVSGDTSTAVPTEEEAEETEETTKKKKKKKTTTEASGEEAAENAENSDENQGSETTVPEDTEDGSTSTSKKKSKKTSVASNENAEVTTVSDSEETTVPENEETTSSKKKKTVTTVAETEETTSKKKKNTTEASTEKSEASDSSTAETTVPAESETE